MSDTKAEILSRIRGALGSDGGSVGAAGVAGTAGATGAASATAALVAVPREYRSAGEHVPGSDAVLELLIDRLVDYKAEVHRTTPEDLPDLLAGLVTQRSAERQEVGSSDYRSPDVLPTTPTNPANPRGAVVVPHGIDRGWVSAMGGVDVRVDSRDAPLSVAGLDGVDAVITAARVAVAETGTIVLDGEPDQGRRAISLVPDVHVCVVRTDQVVQTVPEAVRLLGAEPGRPLTWISGPSATSDIELERVEGVHGPRTLHVVLVA